MFKENVFLNNRLKKVVYYFFCGEILFDIISWKSMIGAL